MTSLARVSRPVPAGRFGFTVTARYVADNDDGTRITMTVEQRVTASNPDDAAGDATGLIEATLELAFPKEDGWVLEPTDKLGPEVECDGSDG